jgi:PAS domain S-box-containing protein
VNASASPFWVPSGIAIAAALLFGLRIWPAVALGAFLVNVTTTGSLATSAGIAIGNTLEAVIAAELVNRFAAGSASFERPQGVLRFAALVVPATAISASVGWFSLWAGGHADPSRIHVVWLTWWLGDLGGALIFTPLIVLWSRRGGRHPVPGSALEAVALALVLGATSWFVFHGSMPFSFAVIPPLVWAALRFGRRGAASAAVATSLIALSGTLQEAGPFAEGSLNLSLLMLQLFVAVITLTALVLAAGTRERERVERDLLRSRAELEEQVKKRTASLADAVEKLQKSRSVLNDAQEVAHIGSWEWDVLANKVLWSDELYRIYGLEPDSEEVTYESYIQRVHPEDRDRTADSIRAALEGKDEFEFEERIVRPGGEIRALQSKGYVMRDESGLPRRMIGTCHDITERKQDELELERRMEELHRSNRELSLLSYAASHDLKEPLRTIVSNVQLIESRLRENSEPEIRRSASFVVEGVRRMNELIDDLLEYSTADRRSAGEVESSDAVAHALEALKSAIGESGARIEIGPLPRVAVGQARLAGLFQNLLSNSMKYRDATRPPEIRISASPVGPMWCFEVADNGRGFDPADAEKVFAIFERLHVDHGVSGTGLGLAICRRIVEAQGGRIWAESVPGRGSVFRFTLPAARSGSTAEEPVQSPISA